MSEAQMAAVTAALQPPAPRQAVRSFDGAAINRLTASWHAINMAIDAELRTDLDKLRARSRDLFKNNEFVVAFGRMIRNALVGPEGFHLSVRAEDSAGVLDHYANRAIEAAFWRWTRPEECDVAGQRSFPDICRAAALALGRDGEFLIRIRRGAGAGAFGFQLQMLDVDRLDTRLNVWPANGRNAIIMGVEVDQWRRPVAYHLWDRHPTESSAAQRVRQRIPADEIIHGFVPIEDEQARGIPWVHAAMRRLRDLDGYREAAVIAARIGASKMGFFTSPDGTPPTAVDGQDSQGNFISEAQPGTFETLPEGYKFEAFNPDYPHAQFDMFNKACIRGIGSALGVSYPSLGNDLEGVSFGSIRSGTIEDRDNWMGLQNFLITKLLVPVYEGWLDMALLRGAILLPNGSALPLAKKAKYQPHQWQGRRWQWIDPLKDMAANVLAIENGLASPQMIAAQTGRDIEEVVDDLQRFRKLLADKGVVLTGTTAPTGTVASAVAASGSDGGTPAKSASK